MNRTFSCLKAIAATTLLSVASVACAADRGGSPSAVIVRDVGQSRVILPAPEPRAEEPYTLAGRPGDEWQQHGHWIDAGQSRVYVPATR